MATQEDAIMEFAKRLAGTGTVVGVSQKDILALSAAMSSVGISAESGGSAMSKVLTKMNNAVQNGGKELQGFASIAGKSGAEFAQIWKSDPYRAVQLFEEGLAKQNKEGHNVKAMLKELGITELRETDTVLRLANGNEQLALARRNANKGWSEGNALSKEAETKYKTLGNQMKIFMNHIRDLGIELGATLAPALIGIMKVLTPMIDALAKAPTPVKAFVVALALIPVAAVPVLGTLAAITGAMGLVGQSMLTAEKAAKSSAKGMGLYRNAMLMLTNPVQGTKKALTSLPGLFGRTGKGILGAIKPTRLLGLGLRGLSAAFRFLTGPIGLALTAITLLWKGFKYAYDHVKWFRDGINGLGTTIKTFAGGIAGVAVKAVKGIGNAFKTAGGWIKDKFVKEYKASQKAIEEDNGATKKFQDRFKQVFKTLGTASKKATDTTKVLGKGVSEGTRKALSKFVDYSTQSDKILAKVKQSHGKITKEETNKLLEIQQDSTDNLLNEFHKRAEKQSEIQQEVFKKNSGLTAKQEQAIMKRTQNQFKESEKNLRQINNRIQELVQKNARDGKLSGKEMEELNKLYDKQRELAVGTLSQTNKEQERILSRMSANRKAYSMKQAQSIVKESIKARDTAKKENKKAYDQEIDHINSMVGLSKEEKEKMLENAQDRYDKANKKADDAHKETLDGLKKSNKNIENEMDLSNGKMYTKAEKWWNNFTDAFLGYFKGLGESWKKHWDQMIDDIASVDWSGIWDGIKNTGSNIGGWFSDKGRGFATNFKQGWNDAIKLGGSIWSWITNTGAGIGTWFANKGHEWYNNFITRWNETKNTMGDLWSGIKEKGSSMGSWFSQKGQSWYSGFKNKWEETRIASGDLWAGIKNTGSNIGSWFAQKGSSFWTSVKTNWDNAMLVTGGLWNSLVTFLSNSFGTVKGFFSGLGSKMWIVLKTGWSLIVNSQAGQLFTSLITKLGTSWDSIKSWFYTKGAQMLTAVVSGWKSLSATAVKTFSILWQNAKNIWSKIWGTIRYYSGLAASWVYKKWQSIKNFTVTFFTSAWTIAKNIWKGITNTIKYWTGLIWNRIKSVFGWIRDKVKSSFTSAWNTTKRIWKGIKGTIQYWTQAIWNRIKAVFNWIKNHIKNALNSVWNTTKRIWKGIKGTIKYWTQAIWNRIKSIYNNIKNFIRNTLDKIWSITKRIWKGMRDTVAHWLTSMYNKVRSSWNNIKNKTSQMAQAAWDAVKNKFKGMYNSAKHWVDEIGNYISNAKKWMKNKAISLGKSVANGAISGLNKMIGGINKISKAITSKNLMKKIPTLSTGTTAPNGVPVNRDGQLKQSTAAIVNDKGPGNGTGARGYQELIQRKNGDIHAPKGRNVLVGLNKGDSVINGRDTQELRKRGMIPKFSTGTARGKLTDLSDIPYFSKGSKKKKNVFESIGNGLKNAVGGFKDKASKTAHNVKEGASDIMSEVGDKIKDTASWLGSKIGDAWDYVEHPSKLVSKVMDSLGINFGKNNKTMEMAGLAYNKLKKMLVDKVKSWFEEYGGGDGSYLFDYPVWQRFGRYTGGLSFNGGRHYGMDFGMPTGTPIYAVKGGVADKVWTDYGGGKSVQIKTGANEWNWYMHLSKQIAKQGQKIRAGQLIGKSGATGSFVRGAHLHFQLMRGSHAGNDTAINPEKWLKNLKGSGGATGSGANYTRSVIKKAQRILGGRYMSASITDNMMRLAKRESNYDPKAVNNWDINAQRGTPSKGLFQMIAPTFRANAKAGYTNFNNPVHQAISAMQYIVRKYGWGGFPRAAAYAYENGGLVRRHQIAEIGEGNKPEMVIPLTKKARAMQLIEQAKQFMGIKDPEIDKEVNINRTVSTTDLSVLEQLLTRVITNQEVTLTLLTKLLESSKVIENKETGILEGTLERLHNKHQDKRERKESRISKYNRGGSK